MKLLHMNSYYAAGKFYKHLYDLQVKKGRNIAVIVPIKSQDDILDFEYGEYTDFRQNFRKVDRYFFHLKHRKILKDILENYKPFHYQLIHAHTLFSNGYIAMKLNEKYGTPYIVAVRSADVITFFKKMIHLRKLGLKILQNAERIIFLAPSHRDHTLKTYVPKRLQEQLYEKITVIPNGIEQFWFTHIGAPKMKPEKSVLELVQVGDINHNKNVETTVKAIAILMKQGYKVNLTLVGKVRDQSIYNKIKELDYVNCVGYKTKEELLRIYKESDIFVLPSIHETFGLVYAEALSQGLPLIYSKGQGFDGQFEEGTVGFGVKSLEEYDIVDKIKKILDNYEEISKNCITGTYDFRWEDIADKYEKIYTSVLTKNKS